MSVAKKKWVFNIFKYMIVGLLALIILIPIINILLCGFKTTYEINQPLSMPSSLNFDNYIKVLTNENVMIGILNSLIITLGAVAICVILCSLASYSLARTKGKLYVLIYFLFVSAMMIPAVANLATIYEMIFKLGLKDTRLGLILLEAALQIPLGVLLYTGFIKNIPRELDEAAVIDGCNFFSRFFRVIFPLLKPVTFSYAALSSVAIWNDFLMPLLIISDSTKKPLTLAIYCFMYSKQNDFGAVYASLIIGMLPPILLFLFSQKYLYSGITAGSVKG